MSATPLTEEILATVPTGAELEGRPAKGTEATPDIKKIKKTYEFWKEVFTNLGEDVFKDQNTATMAFARAVPNVSMDNIPAFKERNQLLETGSSGVFRDQELQFLIKSAGCLVSLAEIESVIGSKEDTLFDDLKALEKAASVPTRKPEPDMAVMKRATRACRELSDLIRKVSYCKKVGKEFSLDYYEVLALYRQEGALALSPFKDSYPFGALIHTEKGRCRSPDVIVTLTNRARPKEPVFVIEREETRNRLSGLRQYEILAKRPGFNLAFSTPLKNASNESYRMIMVITNLLVTAGLDALFKNNILSDDELSQLLLQNINKSDPFSDRIANTTALPKIDDLFLQSQFLALFVGLMLFVLESESHHTGSIPKLSDITSQTEDLLAQLFKSHEIEKKQNKKSGKLVNICLLGNPQAPDTLLCLKIQAMWYSTRRFPYTLLAIKDRDAFKKLPPFSPFVTYLRFHADELIFLGILIRVLKGFGALKKFWTRTPASKKAPAGLEFPDLNAEEAAIQKAFGLIKKIRIDSDHPIKSWISIGLVDHYIRRKIIPEWFVESELRTGSVDYGARLVEAEIALGMMAIIKKHNLIPTLNFVLEFTPIKTLFEIKVFEDGEDPAKRLFMSKVFTKAHSFERVRLVYKAADEKPVLKKD